MWVSVNAPIGPSNEQAMRRVPGLEGRNPHVESFWSISSRGNFQSLSPTRLLRKTVGGLRRRGKRTTPSLEPSHVSFWLLHDTRCRVVARRVYEVAQEVSCLAGGVCAFARGDYFVEGIVRALTRGNHGVASGVLALPRGDDGVAWIVCAVARGVCRVGIAHRFVRTCLVLPYGLMHLR
jgi:hypothetical protein